MTNPAIARYFACNDISSSANPNGQNNIGWCNSEFDKLQLLTEIPSDYVAAKNAAFRMQEIMYDEVPVIPLYAIPDVYGYRTAKFASAPIVGAGLTNPWFDIVNWVVN